MNNNTLKILVVLLLVVSAGLAFLWNAERTKVDNLTRLQTSAFTQSVNAIVSGEVAAIGKQSITLKRDNEILLIPFGEGAVFNRILSQPAQGQTPEREQINLEDVLVADTVDIFANVLGGGTLRALRINVRAFVPQ